MIQDDIRSLAGMAERRDAARQAWLRHLHLLAAGALTLLAGMGTGSGSTGLSQCWLRATWAALGFAILAGGAALYGETARHQALGEKLAEDIKSAMDHGSAVRSVAGTVRAPRPRWLRAAEAGFLTSLAAATICLVAFAVSR